MKKIVILTLLVVLLSSCGSSNLPQSPTISESSTASIDLTVAENPNASVDPVVSAIPIISANPSETISPTLEPQSDSSIKNQTTTQSVELSREDQYTINLFLSNFSEQGFGPYDSSTGINQIAPFTYIFAIINSYNNITERQENGMAYDTITLDYVNKVSMRFFNRQFSREEASTFSWDQQHSFYRDGVFYFEMAAGATYCNFTVVDRLEHADDDTYIAYFHNYLLANTHVMDSSLYHMTPQEAEASSRIEVLAQGVAHLTRDSAGKYHLLEYDWELV